MLAMDDISLLGLHAYEDALPSLTGPPFYTSYLLEAKPKSRRLPLSQLQLDRLPIEIREQICILVFIFQSPSKPDQWYFYDPNPEWRSDHKTLFYRGFKEQLWPSNDSQQYAHRRPALTATFPSTCGGTTQAIQSSADARLSSNIKRNTLFILLCLWLPFRLHVRLVPFPCPFSCAMSGQGADEH